MLKETSDPIESKLSILVTQTAKIQKRIINLETYILEAFSRVFAILLHGTGKQASFDEVPLEYTPELRRPCSAEKVDEESQRGGGQGSPRDVKGNSGVNLTAVDSRVLECEQSVLIKLNKDRGSSQEKIGGTGRMFHFKQKKRKASEEGNIRVESLCSKRIKKNIGNVAPKRKNAKNKIQNYNENESQQCMSTSPFSKIIGREKRPISRNQMELKNPKTKFLSKKNKKLKNRWGSIQNKQKLEKYEKKSMSIMRIKQRNNMLKKNLNSVNSHLKKIQRNAEELKSKLSESFQDQMDFLDELSWDIKVFEEHGRPQKTPTSRNPLFNHPNPKRGVPAEINLRHEAWLCSQKKPAEHPNLKKMSSRAVPSLCIDSEVLMKRGSANNIEHILTNKVGPLLLVTNLEFANSELLSFE
jgi:hypothetical protein